MATIIESGREFIAGRIINAFGVGQRLFEQFNGKKKVAEHAKKVPAGTRLRKRFRGINIADPKFIFQAPRAKRRAASV